MDGSEVELILGRNGMLGRPESKCAVSCAATSFTVMYILIQVESIGLVADPDSPKYVH